MKINLLFLILFLSVTVVSITFNSTERIGGTQLNGNGCVCHTTEESPNVHVWIEGPDTMAVGNSANYRMYMFGGPAIAGGYNVAVRFGLLGLVDSLSLLIDNELTQSVPLPFSSITDTIFWEFTYTAPDSVAFDTLYSVGLSTNWDSIPDDRDQWAYGPKFVVRIVDNPVPVELSSFNAEIMNSRVILTWLTASEINNKGFVVERKALKLYNSINNLEYENIGFVNGKGTSTSPQSYSFADDQLANGYYSYRLKQIDFDGKFSYSSELKVVINSDLAEFNLSQNYPNPFNPSTIITWQSPISSRQTLKVYDILGNEVAVLVDEYKPAGRYNVQFSADDNLSSGVYLINLNVGSYSITKKMLLLR